MLAFDSLIRVTITACARRYSPDAVTMQTWSSDPSRLPEDRALPFVPEDASVKLVAAAADYYEDYWAEFNPVGAISYEVERAYNEVVKSDTKWLDVGCGDGRTSGLWLRDRGCEYTGVDVSATAVNEAKTLGLNASLIADAGELPFPDNAFDGVACIEVFEHLFQPQLAAREIRRVAETRRGAGRRLPQRWILAPPCRVAVRQVRPDRRQPVAERAVARPAHPVLYRKDADPDASPGRLPGRCRARPRRLLHRGYSKGRQETLTRPD